MTTNPTTTHQPRRGGKAATMATTIHTTSVTPASEAEAAVPFGGGNYTLSCTCGERVTYSGQQFTLVEARRHQAWHEKTGR